MLDDVLSESSPETSAPQTVTYRFIVRGRVQGVGFRPFVYQCAKRLGLSGWVRNSGGEVEIIAQGQPHVVTEFRADLMRQAPDRALPDVYSSEEIVSSVYTDFRIIPSNATCRSRRQIPTDASVCEACLREMNDPGDRRYQYPFINCTQCGPRYTLIADLPYDRDLTGMSSFRMCESCRQEYSDPGDRRFHAEIIACPECGPRLFWSCPQQKTRNESRQALDRCIAMIRAGGVVAVKGIGGYHLVCDATSPQAVLVLRERKQRPAKPFAVMFPDQEGHSALRHCVEFDKAQLSVLRGPIRPILLLQKKKHSILAEDVAPGLKDVGAMLPYTPLHDLLLNKIGKPLVMTSANIGGEPVLTDGEEVEDRLASVADGFLHHNRPIVRHADDAVLRWIGGKARPVRLGRGVAPLELVLPDKLPRPVLATGGI